MTLNPNKAILMFENQDPDYPLHRKRNFTDESKNLYPKNNCAGSSKQLGRATKLVARISNHFAALLIILKILAKLF